MLEKKSIITARNAVVMALVVLFVLIASTAHAATRAFAQRFSTNAAGDITMIGNVLLHCPLPPSAACSTAQSGGAGSNNGFTMAHVNVAGGVTNSSSATLSMPAGSTVAFAGLYWAGTSTNAARNTARFRTPASASYSSITGAVDDSGSATVYYQAFANVTAQVAAAGNGVYSVADVVTSTGTNTLAGWTLVVVYQNTGLPTRNLAVYDGYQRIAGAGSVDITLSGFVTPPFGPVNTTIGTVAYDGDKGSSEGAAGLQFGPTTASLSPVFNAVNPQTDYFNSTISLNGVNVTTGRTPNYSNTLGLDIDLSKPNTPLTNGASTAVVRVSSSSETIDLGIVTLATDIFVPNIKESLIKTAVDLNGGALLPGDVIEYTIGFGNTGNDGAVNVVVSDPIPANTTYEPGSLVIVASPGGIAGVKTDAADGDQADVSAGTVRFRVGTGATGTTGGAINPGQSVSLRFRVRVNASTPGETLISNTAQVIYRAQTIGTTITDLSDADPVTPGDQPTTNIVASPDLQLTKSHIGNFVQGQSGATYTISATNSGTSATFGSVTVTDTLPAELSATAISGSGWACTLATLSCTRSDVLAVGASYPPITVTVNVSPTAPASVTNSASISCTCEGDSKTANNTVSDATTVAAGPVLSLSKTAVGSFVRGATASFNLTVSNAGAAGPTNGSTVTVSDTLPAGLTLSGTPSGSGWSCSVSSATAFTCTRSDVLAAGTSYPPVSVAVNVEQSAPANVTNSASVGGGGNSGSASGNVGVTIASSADVSVDKSASNLNPNIGTNVTFTLTARNSGPSDASGVVVTDLLPAGLVFQSATPAAAYNSGTGQWTIGTLASGANAALQIVARYDGPGQVTNNASITATTPDPVPDNNAAPPVAIPSQIADLSLSKAVNSATPPVGGNVTFTLTLSNAGPAPATNIQVRDQLPAGLTFVSASPAGQYSAATGIWSVASLNTGTSTTLQIVATVSGSAPVTNVAQVIASDQFDPNSTPNNNDATENDQASSAITPQGADLSISKSVDNANPTLGQNITFTLSVDNAGPAAATGVVVNDLLPAGLAFISSSPSQGSYVSSTGVWTVGTIASGASASLTITVKFNGPGAVTNTASVTSAVPDPNLGNNASSPVTVPSQIADLSMSKIVSNATPNIGDNVTYTLTVANAGPNSATNVKVSDALPVGLTFVSATPNQGSYVSATGLWSVGTLASGANATLQLVATVNASGAITNTAQVAAADQFDPNSTPNNNDASENDQASVTLTGQSADVAVTKSVDNANPTLGSAVNFTVRVTNNGPGTAQGVSVNDLLPAGLTLNSANPSQGAYNATTGVWTIGSMINGGIATLLVNATFNGPGQVTNTASVTSSTPDPNPSGNSASVTVPSQIADLSLGKTVDNATPNVGANITFTLTLNNAGPNAATNVRVSDVLPAGLSFVSFSASQGSYAAGTGVWNVGSVANGTGATLQITAQVTASAPLVNIAQVSASDQFDPNSTPNNNNAAENDQASAPVTPQSADLSVAKTVTNPNPQLGEQITFTVTVTNAGPTAATGVIVNDALPSGLTLVSASASQGSYAGGVWNAGTLGNGGSANLLVTATFTGPGQVTNIATVASSTPDPNTGGNTASVTVPSQIADLSLTKTASTTTPNSGENISFTITLSNSGPNTATGIQVIDLLPSGLQFVSANPSQGAYDNASGAWTVGTVANGASATLTIVATATGLAPVTNTAQVSAANQFDSNSTPNNNNASENDQASVTITPQSADLSVAKSVSNNNPTIGSSLTYTITVNNAGPSTAVNVVVNDPLPTPGLSFTSASASQGSFNSSTGVWTVGNIAAGSSAALQVVATFNGPGQVTNSANVSSATPDPNAGGNSASITVPSQIADLSLTKSVSTLTPALGANVTYTVRVANAGPNNASNVHVSEPLPSGLTLISATPTQGTYNNVSGEWVVGGLANGASATLTIVATVASVVPISNTAQVSASDQFDPNSTPNNNNAAENDQASVTITPQSADLSLTKTVDNPNPKVGDTFNYTVTLSNAGPGIATNVRVLDHLPSGLTFISALPSQGSYDATSGVWDVGTVLNGAAPTLQITARITISGQVTNTAQIAAADQPDPNPSGNSAEVTVPQQVADLVLSKSVNNAAPNVGSNVTFSIALTNAGPNAATAVEVKDLLPSGLEFVSASASVGNYNAASGLWAVGTLASSGSALLAITAKVIDSGAITNTAQVSASDQFDPNSIPNNNNAAENDQASVTLAPQSADLTIAKGVNIANPLPGSNVVFTLTVSNAGPSNAASVVVNDLLPAGLTFQSATPSQGTYTPVSGVWSVGTLNANTQATLTMTAQYVGPGQVTNTAAVASTTPDLNGAGNSASIAVPSQIADLALSKTLAPSAPRVGENATFTVAVTNAGPNTATGVKVAEQIGAGLQFVSAVTTIGAYDLASGVWSVGAIASGGTAQLTIVARVTDPGAISNTAQISASDQFDPNSTPNNSNAAENDQSSVNFTAIGASLSGTVYVDLDGSNSFSAGDKGIAGVTLLITGIDINNQSVTVAAVTDADGNYSFTGLSAASAAGYTLAQTQPGGYQSGASTVGSAGGTAAAVNQVSAIALGAGVAATGYNFGELASSLSGSVWQDLSTNRTRDAADVPLAGWKAEVLDAVTGALVKTSAPTDADGRYSITGLAPGNYKLQFRDPTNNIVFGTPTNGENNDPQPGSSVDSSRAALNITLNPGENKVEQSLPIDPNGVVYDSASRQPVPGAVVAFCGGAGFNPALHLVGGASYVLNGSCASMTVGPQGFYQYLLTAGAPTGQYTLQITPPAGYSLSTLIPAESGALTPPFGGGAFAVQPQATPPQPSQATTHYFAFNLSVGVQDVINNHVPLDSGAPSALFITKQASVNQAEIGDSIGYEIRIRNASGVTLPGVILEDRLPAGFKLLPKSVRLRAETAGAVQTINERDGSVGSVLHFAVGDVAGNTTLILNYRVRVSVGAQEGDGVNRAQAASGVVRSNTARAKVKVTGGVFTKDACIIGKVYADCNANRVQDSGEPGVGGVRLYLEDGTYFITDSEGKYSYCGLRPITHVLKVDATTLPKGGKLGIVDNRNALDPASRFVDLRNGELHRADFLIDGCVGEVLDSIKNRSSADPVLEPKYDPPRKPGRSFDSRKQLRGTQP